MRLLRPSSRLQRGTDFPPTEAPPAPSLLALNARRLRENARVLGFLGAASTLGATAGLLGLRTAASSRTRAFSQAAVGVHLFVLGSALAGGWAVRTQPLPRLGLRSTLRRSRLLQRVLGVGLGLDVAAATVGALLLRRRGHSAWREGAGASLLLHGAALLLFDSGVFSLNARYHRQVRRLGRTASGKVLRMPPAWQVARPGREDHRGAFRE
jgi:hypothetical protein